MSVGSDGSTWKSRSQSLPRRGKSTSSVSPALVQEGNSVSIDEESSGDSVSPKASQVLSNSLVGVGHGFLGEKKKKVLSPFLRKISQRGEEGQKKSEEQGLQGFSPILNLGCTGDEALKSPNRKSRPGSPDYRSLEKKKNLHERNERNTEKTDMRELDNQRKQASKKHSKEFYPEKRATFKDDIDDGESDFDKIFDKKMEKSNSEKNILERYNLERLRKKEKKEFWLGLEDDPLNQKTRKREDMNEKKKEEEEGYSTETVDFYQFLREQPDCCEEDFKKSKLKKQKSKEEDYFGAFLKRTPKKKDKKTEDMCQEVDMIQFLRETDDSILKVLKMGKKKEVLSSSPQATAEEEEEEEKIGFYDFLRDPYLNPPFSPEESFPKKKGSKDDMKQKKKKEDPSFSSSSSFCAHSLSFDPSLPMFPLSDEDRHRALQNWSKLLGRKYETETTGHESGITRFFGIFYGIIKTSSGLKKLFKGVTLPSIGKAVIYFLVTITMCVECDPSQKGVSDAGNTGNSSTSSGTTTGRSVGVTENAGTDSSSNNEAGPGTDYSDGSDHNTNNLHLTSSDDRHTNINRQFSDLHSRLRCIAVTHKISGATLGDYYQVASAFCDTIDVLNQNDTDNNSKSLRNIWTKIFEVIGEYLINLGEKLKEQGITGTVSMRPRKNASWKKTFIQVTLDTLYIFKDEKIKKELFSISLKQLDSVDKLNKIEHEECPFDSGFEIHLQMGYNRFGGMAGGSLQQGSMSPSASYLWFSCPQQEAEMWTAELRWRMAAFS